MNTGGDSLRGLACLVTGGAQGIGLASAMACARHGASVALLDLDATHAERSARVLADRFGVATASAQADVADAAAVEAAVAACSAALGRIDVLVNCAGIMTPRLAPVATMPIEDVQKMFDVHVRGAFLCSRAVIPGMTARGFGRIVNISSVLGLLGLPFRSGYAIAKHAINGFTRSLAVEVARAGITVNAVAPGYILTETLQARLDAGMLDYARYADRAPAGRWGLPEEVGHAIAFLALPASGFITGAVIPVDGGYTMRGDPGEAIGEAQDAAALAGVRALFATAGTAMS
ncbi:3-oxoacyl-[acyl-carrier-protein] reductase FabG [Variovorax sp. SRS16]|uniref:SDR family NAD(P)-dependent oxidoreductase n=1 Tax=Variovorax sp. SRS16 TaxID=282217 RepID=UPI001319A3B2|nr:SDR family NAD(P)-dependent oxidoreductase [Variovorax sp. SRS16]VTU25833.1 3-oxoacyl-[acyl-carrier-protein] reductase FabG [Variovorax sp. SRS16]